MSIFVLDVRGNLKISIHTVARVLREVSKLYSLRGIKTKKIRSTS